MDSSRAYGAPSRTSSALARTHRTQAAERAKSPTYPLSPLLQERLQRLRQAENERASAQSSREMLASSTSSRSPSSTDSQRPISSGGPEPAKPRKGLGVKEMEQTLSTLHKQNFDLKLEVYHRRERQSALEERLEKLERDAKERDELNNALVKELEKRDKAVEDAIGMILTLEKRVEQLLLERNMVRQVEADGTAYPRIDSPAVAPAAKRTSAFDTMPFGETKTPIRMPSFVSDRSETIENSKSAYLGAGDSALSLPRMAEDTPDTARRDPRLASPALSDLSESSFFSVYGRGKSVELPSPPASSPWPCDGSSRNPLAALESPTRIGTATPRQHRPPSSCAVSGQFHNIGDVLDTAAPPLQRLEKAGVTPAAPETSPKPASGSMDRDQPLSVRPPTSQGQPKTKKEKREALERVLTQGHFSSPQALPPTPDTLSSTTLPHNDTPSKEQGPEHERSYMLLSEMTPSGTEGFRERSPPSRAAQTACTTAFDGRKQARNGDDRRSSRSLAAGESQQPRSAHGPTSARARDENSRGGDSVGRRHHMRTDSTASSVDTWLRESLKPESLDALDPMSSVSQAHASVNEGRVSPDLFSFPTSTSGWTARAMFGTLGGNGYVVAGGKDASATPIADMLDAIDASLPTPPLMGPARFTPAHGTGPRMPPPPTPDRRSSLFAKTGTTADAFPAVEDISQSPVQPASAPSAHTRGSALNNRARSNSTNVRPPTRHLTELGLKQDRAMTTSRPRSRGLNSFFRRSTGSAETTQPPAPPGSAPPTQTAFKPPPMGIPSWVRRNSVADDERASGATPPPILRNKGAPSGNEGGVGMVNDDDGGVTLEASPAAVAAGADVAVSTAPSSASSFKPSRKSWGGTSGEGAEGGGVPLGNPVSSSGGAGKRKWLGLGRVGSLRNRGA
ncbi:hypothetical protein C8A03DRAFT_16182 [Achaetomium macrosporum]|uniref:Centrosomin N-terminal motif 1 domain-containing protein n=1 Tax=Achaetomium macrosporum TaxID=79813 RepID=A0AAN7C8C1_9PEZI|nr:hypothetical protein C8A03DRAFT_16182 [Achaetomium macrosporum]